MSQSLFQSIDLQGTTLLFFEPFSNIGAEMRGCCLLSHVYQNGYPKDLRLI